MEVEIADEELQNLLQKGPGDSVYSPGVAKAFRRRIIDILAAHDERDLHAFRSWRFKKLSGSRTHQRSVRLNDQWRLIIEIEKGHSGNTIHIISIEDYH